MALLQLWAFTHSEEMSLVSPMKSGVVIEGVKVLSVDSVILAFILLFWLIYALDLSYPDNLKYTFEFVQKILMSLDGHKVNTKIQQLKIKLFM